MSAVHDLEADRKRKGSRYRQIRLTFTEEYGGRLSYAIYAKGLNQAWDEHHCLVRDSVKVDFPIRSTEDAINAIQRILMEQYLPD